MKVTFRQLLPAKGTCLKLQVLERWVIPVLGIEDYVLFAADPTQYLCGLGTRPRHSALRLAAHMGFPLWMA